MVPFFMFMILDMVYFCFILNLGSYSLLLHKQYVFARKSLIYSWLRVFVLTKIDAGEIIYDLRKKIQQIQSDLDQLGEPASEIPELITSANLLRSNEYLLKANEKKTELLLAYTQYSKALEELLSIVFDIQNDLKEIVKEQSSMIPSQRKKHSKTKTKSKVSKK